MMKPLIAVSLGVALILLVFSCAQVPTQPLAPGEVRLLDIQVPSRVTVSFPYEVTITFRADGRPEIRRACCSGLGGGPYCFKAISVKYGLPGSFTIQLPPANPGSYTLECYAEYLQDGGTQHTNVVGSQINVFSGAR